MTEPANINPPPAGARPSIAEGWKYLDLLSDPLLLLDPAQLIVFANHAFCTAFGYPLAELRGQPLPGLMPAEERAAWAGWFAAAPGDPGQASLYEHQLRRQDGAWEEVEASLAWLAAADGPALAAVQLRVITARKRAAAELMSREAHYRLLVETSDDVVWLLNLADFRFLYISPAVYRLRGYTPAEAMRESALDAMPPASREIAQRTLEEELQALRAGRAPRPIVIEVEQWHKDGTLVWTEVAASFTFGPDGIPTHLVGLTRNISARKRAEHQLHVVLEAIPDGVLAIDPHGTILLANAQCEALLGYPPAQLQGRSVDILLPERLRAVHPNNRAYFFQTAAQQSASARHDLFALHKDGHEFPVEVNLTRAETQHGPTLIAVIRDVSHHKALEQQLREAEQKYRRLIERSPVVVYSDVVGGDWQYISPQVTGLLGYPPEALMQDATLFQRRIHPEDVARYRAELTTAVAQNTSLRLEYRVLTATGEMVWLRDEADVTRDPATGEIRLHGVLSNITERKSIEAALRLSEQRFKNIIDYALDAVITTDEAQRIIVFNDAAERVFGYPAAEVVGQPLSRLIPQRFHEGHRLDVAAFGQMAPVQRAGITRQTVTGRRANGEEFPCEVSISVTPAEGQRIYNAIVRDISDQKRAEAALRQSAEDLRQAQAAANLGNWAYDVVTHQFTGSEAAYRILGWEPRPHSWHEFLGLVHPEDRARLREPWRAVLAGRDYYAEHRVVVAGGVKWLSVRGAVTLDDRNRPRRLVGILQDITERKQAELALYSVQHRLRHLLTSSPVVIYSSRITPPYGATFVSDNIAMLTGHSPHAFTADEHFWASHIHPDERARILAEVPLAFEQGAFRQEYRFQHPDGSYHWLRDEFQLVRDAAGQPLEFVGSWSDISARKQVEAALQVSEDRYRQLVENSHDLIQSVTPDGRFLFVNRAWLETLEYTADEVPLLNLWDIIHPASREQCTREFAAVLQGNDNGILRPVFLTKHGAAVEVEGIAVARIVNGRPVATNAFFRNVTGQRQAARLQAARFAVSRIVAESPPIPVALTQALEAIATQLDWQVAEWWKPDPQGAGLHWQGGWHQPGDAALEAFVAEGSRLALEPGQGLPGLVWATGRPIWTTANTATPNLPRAAAAIAADLQTGVAVPISEGSAIPGVIAFAGRGQRPYDEAFVAALTDLGRQLGQFLARKEAEAALAAERNSLAQRVEARTADLSRANAELAQAVRTKDEFLANMSHELRTPLNAILAFSESLLEELSGPLNPRQQESLQHIATSGQHLLALINDILDLSKVEAGRLELQSELVPLVEICQASLQFVREAALKKSILLSFGANDQLAAVMGDPRRLKQILVNLLSNAVKFTPAGGRVNLQVTVAPDADVVRLAVRDSGIGIPHADLPRLFQPFTQLDSSLSRQHEGTGLGLALVRRLTELHNGSIVVESEVGQGSCFTVVLPYHRSAEPFSAAPGRTGPLPNAAAPAHEGAPPTAAARLLLAEDNEVNIQAIRDYLQDKGYHVLVARNGREALALAAEAQPALILMDIQMPEMDGLEAIRQLRAQPAFAATPIIALTALAMPGDRERCLAAGANDYLTKPVSLRGLREVIRQQLNG